VADGMLKVCLAGLELANPTVLASGVLGYSAEVFQRVEASGAGAVVTKSVGVAAREGYMNPTVCQVRCGLVNAMGLPNPGIDVFVEEVARAKALLSVPVIVSVYGFRTSEYAYAAVRAASAGADAVELNVSCPHVEGTGSEVGQDEGLLAEVVREVKRIVRKPVFVKLSPNVADIASVAEAAVAAGADGLTVANTLKALAIDVETGIPVLGNRRGGLSGPAVKPVVLRCVYDVYERVNVPIVGCGGVTSWRDAVEYFLAGASAVQVGTAVATRGLSVFAEITRGVAAYLRRKGYGGLAQVVGLSHRR
jgi:dihydroorotate dehydrogenase (NAD+) catalytic subunit